MAHRFETSALWTTKTLNFGGDSTIGCPDATETEKNPESKN